MAIDKHDSTTKNRTIQEVNNDLEAFLQELDGMQETMQREISAQKTPTLTDAEQLDLESGFESVVNAVGEIKETLQTIGEPAAVKSPAPVLTSAVQAEQSKLEPSLRQIIAEYDPSHAESFEVRLKSLVEMHGFKKFEDAFHQILISNDMTKQQKALAAVNRYIINTKADTLIDLVAEGEKFYAKEVLAIINTPNDVFLERAKQNITPEKIAEASQKISELKITLAATSNKQEKEEIEKKIKQIMEDVPAIKADSLRRKRLLDSSLSLLAYQNNNKVINYIINDLCQGSIDQRTLKMESYILLAEKMLAAGKITVVHELHAALTFSAVNRLRATARGLSSHAQQQLQQMDILFDRDSNFRAIREYCENNNLVLPVSFMTTDITFTLDGNPTIPPLITEGPFLLKPCLELPTMKKIKEDCQKLLRITPLTYHSSIKLREDIDQAPCSQSVQDDFDNKVYAMSCDAEPRGQEGIEPSEVISRLETVMHLKSPVGVSGLAILANFKGTDVLGFHQSCDALVEKHSFAAFRNAVDDLLTSRKLLQQTRKTPLRELHQYVMNNMALGISSTVLAGAKKQAQAIRDIFNKPSPELMDEVNHLVKQTYERLSAQELAKQPGQPLSEEQMKSLKKSSINEVKKLIEQEQIKQPNEEQRGRPDTAQVVSYFSEKIAAIDLLAQAQELADEDSYKEVRDMAKAKIQKEAEDNIAAIKGSDASADMKEKDIEAVRSNLKQELTAIDTRAMPIDYYVEKIRYEKINDDRNAAANHGANAVTNYIIHDLLSNPAIDKRTVLMERYVLMAEKLMGSGDMQAAYAIHLALSHEATAQLSKTQEGLSQHAKQVITDMNHLFGSDNNMVAKDLTFGRGNKFNRLVQVDAHGKLTQTLQQNFSQIVEKVIDARPEAVRSSLAAEMKNTDDDLYTTNTSRDYTLELMPASKELKERVLYITVDENKPEHLKYTVKSANGALNEGNIPIKDIKKAQLVPPLTINELQKGATEILNIAAQNKHIPPPNLDEYFHTISQKIEPPSEQDTLEPSSSVKNIKSILRPKPTLKQQLAGHLEEIETGVAQLQGQMEQLKARGLSFFDKIQLHLSSAFSALREKIQTKIFSILLSNSPAQPKLSKDEAPKETEQQEKYGLSSTDMEHLFTEALQDPGELCPIPPSTVDLNKYKQVCRPDDEDPDKPGIMDKL